MGYAYQDTQLFNNKEVGIGKSALAIQQKTNREKRGGLPSWELILGVDCNYLPFIHLFDSKAYLR
jgi:hypothetical protein